MNAAISFDELLRYNEEETERWRQWFHAHPEALDLPLDVAHTDTVRGLLVHIFAVEVLYTERIVGQSRTNVSLADFPAESVNEIFEMGEDARGKFREYLSTWSDADWLREQTFTTLTAGTQTATRRKMFVHAMQHSVRHWAQLATALRQAGLKQDWSHDFLFSNALA